MVNLLFYFSAVGISETLLHSDVITYLCKNTGHSFPQQNGPFHVIVFFTSWRNAPKTNTHTYTKIKNTNEHASKSRTRFGNILTSFYRTSHRFGLVLSLLSILFQVSSLVPHCRRILPLKKPIIPYNCNSGI